MSTYGSLEELLKNQKDRYENNCNDGKCSSCGECCTDLLPLNDAKIKRLKSYAERHNLKENRHNLFWDKKATDLTCPFRNNELNICEVYPVRPVICREFICSKSLDQAKADRDSVISQSRSIRSLRYEVFGNPESLVLVTNALEKVRGGLL